MKITHVNLRTIFLIVFCWIIILIAFTAVQIIILSIWGGIDEYKSNIYLDYRRFEYYYYCDSNYLPIWLGLEVAIFVLSFIALTVLIYSTWSVLAIIIPSFKWLLVANYNLILTFLIMIPLSTVFSKDDEQVFVLCTIAILFTTLWSVMSLVGTQIPHCYKINIQNTKEVNELSSLLEKS